MESNRPNARRIALRYLVLLSHRYRLIGIEMGWLNRPVFQKELSAAEKAYFDTPMDELTDQQTINASWRIEAEVVLAWALGIHDQLPAVIPGEGVGSLQTVVAHTNIDIFNETLAGQANLRGTAEIEEAYDRYWNTEWALRDMRISGPCGRGGEHEVEGRKLNTFPSAELSIVKSTVKERCHALCWLMGCSYDGRWENTAMST